MKRTLLFLFVLSVNLTGCNKDDTQTNAGLFPFFDENRKWGYIDIHGDVKIEPQWNQANRFIMDRAIIWLNYKPGMIDKNGNMVIPFNTYDQLGIMDADISSLLNPKFLVGAKLGGLWGFLDKDGFVKVPLQYQEVNNFLNGLAAVKVNGKYGFIDENGNLDIPAIYDGRGWFSENLCWVGKLTDGVIKWGVINKEGETVIPFEYDNNGGDLNTLIWFRFVNGMSPWFKKGGGSGFLNTRGDLLFGLTGSQYDWTYNFSEGLAPVCQDSLIGFINENGMEVIPIQFKNVFDFKNGTAPFRYTTKELWGYINKNGEVVIPQQFLSANNIIEGLAWVKFQDTTSGYINSEGEIIWKSLNIYK